MRAVVWNARAALLYSVGGWTLLGAMLHHTQSSARRDAEAEGSGGGGAETEGDPELSAGPLKKVTVTNTPIGIQITTVVTYHEKPETPLARLAYRLRTYFNSQLRGPSESECEEAGNSAADQGRSL